MSSLGLSKNATENPIKTNFGGLPCVIKLYLIALSIYYQVIVFIYSPTRMRVFEKPKTFLIFDTKARKWILLFFTESLKKYFLKMNDRRATFSFLHLVSAESYSAFVFCKVSFEFFLSLQGKVNCV